MSKSDVPADALSMSDDDFMKIDPSAFEAEAEDSEDSGSDTESEDPDTTDDLDEGEQDDPDTEEDPDEEEEEDPDPDSEQDDETDTKDEDSADPVKDKADEADPEKETQQKTTEPTESEFAAIGRQIMSEFKANGTNIKMKSAEDAIQLMQMGANYHKKMTGLKPSLKTLKLLDNHGLMDPEKINYLIDLSQKKPEAIKQLLKESKLDPMEIDMDDETKYVPNARTVNDTELVLDEVLESISESPQYDRTLTVLGDQWDDPSRKAIAANPNIIRTINTHMENGIFDQVAEAVAYERRLGKLEGISDFEAYQRIGTHMNENKLFRPTGVQTTDTTKHQDPPPKNEGTDRSAERKNRKKAASPSRQRKAPAGDKKDYDPLTMSDEEFIKLNKLNL